MQICMSSKLYRSVHDTIIVLSTFLFICAWGEGTGCGSGRSRCCGASFSWLILRGFNSRPTGTDCGGRRTVTVKQPSGKLCREECTASHTTAQLLHFLSCHHLLPCVLLRIHFLGAAGEQAQKDAATLGGGFLSFFFAKQYVDLS